MAGDQCSPVKRLDAPRPLLLFVCHPLTGHLTPTIRVASELVSRGWKIFFLGPTAHEARIVASGATFYPLSRDADINDLVFYSKDNPEPPVHDYHERTWQDRALIDMKVHCIDTIPSQWESVKAVLLDLHRADPAREVVVVCEAFFHGLMPMQYGAPLPPGVRRPRTACLSVTPPLIRSIDLPPFGSSQPPPNFDYGVSLEDRDRIARAWDKRCRKTEGLSRLLNQKMAQAGAASKVPAPFLSGYNYVKHDAILQIGTWDLFYPVKDWPRQLRFCGVIPATPAPVVGWKNLPSWWNDVLTTDKKIVVVTQGTVECDPAELIIPTIEAMALHTDEVLVVAILGRRGATLPANFKLPSNVRIADYLNYEAVLPHAHAWVHNGSFGALTHGIAHGVPMVVAGEAQDKLENSRLVAYAKIGVNLGTSKPGIEAVREGIETVLDDRRFAVNVGAMRRQSQRLGCFDAIEDAVWMLTGGGDLFA